MRLGAFLGTLVLAVVLTAPTPASAESDDPPPQRRTPTVVVTADPLPVGPVPATITGVNQRWLRHADGAWDPRRRAVRTDVAQLLRRIGLGSVRYPGGTVANLFDHRQALDRPGCQTSGGLLKPIFGPIRSRESGYTIGRHAAFSRSAGSRTNLMVPMINTTPERAVAFVRAVAQATGQRAFTVEVGNEPYVFNQRYWRSKKRGVRMQQYIRGAVRYRVADHALYSGTGCNLRKPAEADGTRNQTFRPRYTPISVTHPPRVWVAGEEWRFVPDIRQAGLFGKAFSVDADRDRIVFGNGLVGAKPRGRLRIRYTAGPLPGFQQLYAALKAVPGLDIDVCSAWASGAFVRRMAALGLPYDCLAPHAYAHVYDGRLSPGEEYRRLLAAARAEGAKLQRLRSMARGRYLAVTEYGSWNHGRPTRDQFNFLREMTQAIHVIGQIRAGVRLSNLSNFGAVLQHHGPRASLSGTGYLMAMVRRLVGQQPVHVTGVPRSLVVTGTRRGPSGALLVVNTSLTARHTVSLQLAGRSASTCVGVRSLSAAPMKVTRPRRFGRPTSVDRPRSRVWGDGALQQTFAPHSVTLLTFQPRTSGCGEVRVP